MTDLEMTRLCAEAMDYYPDVVFSQMGAAPLLCYPDGASDSKGFDYDPLHDDAQAMALVKRNGLAFYYRSRIVTEPRWEVCDQDGRFFGFSKDLNRAIVECVAKMQARKQKK